MMKRYGIGLLVVWFVVSATTSLAEDVAIPAPLEPWVEWVLDGHEDVACPLGDDLRICAWPGYLRLDLDDRGGRFVLDVHADRATTIALPGGLTRWPLDVLAGRASARLRRVDDRPMVWVDEGDSRLEGSFRWSRLPESLAIPPEVALVSLRLHGEEISNPKREEGGLLWLAPGDDESAESDRLTIEVNRRIADGVPVVVETWLRLRVSGVSREISLGSPLPDGFEAIALASGLPARLDAEGHLRVQLRPGEWEIRVAARSLAPVHAIAVAEKETPWPDEETWVFAAAPEVRSVRLEGLGGVDPKRTSLPELWQNLPAFRALPGSTFEIVELRRGAADPGPDEIRVERSLWLSQDGDSFTVRDHLMGTMKTGGRLDLQGAGELGRVSSEGQDRLITMGSDGRSGVEIRAENLDLTAELTYERAGSLPAVGWSRDASQLSGTLRLPPGWSLIATWGIDRAQGSWLSKWTLLDLFFLLLISFGCWRLFDLRLGLIAFAILGISWHEAEAPCLVWLFLLAVIALGKILPDGRLTRMVAKLRIGLLAILAIQWIVFAWHETRTGLFPQLERAASSTATQPASPAMQIEEDMALDRIQVAPEAEVISEAKEANLAQSSMPGRATPKKRISSYYATKSEQRDLNAVVQTGPGLPEWNWRSHALVWTGPVAESETMRLILISPGLEKILSLARVLGLGLIGLVLVGWRRLPFDRRGAQAAMIAICILALPSSPVRAQDPTSEIPESGILEELERRLTAAPECHPDCVEMGRMVLEAGDTQVSLSVDLHAAADTFWRLPGPDSAWRPREVRVDGRSAALRRLEDGFLAIRLEEGSHRVEAVGRTRDGLTLRFPLTPRSLDWRGGTWILEGYSEEGPPPSSVRLSRQQPIESTDEETQELAPWIQVRRRLDLGIPWLVHNEIRRLGPSGVALLLKVPLIPGENVTTSDVSVENGMALVRLAAGERLRRWESTLEEAEVLELEAPSTAEWTESWELACSPIFSCRASGLASSRQVADGQWIPEWMPWPGEALRIEISRPEVAAGVATTIHDVELTLQPGRRLRQASLALRVRTSQGGEQSLELPEGVDLQSFEVNGEARSVRREGREWTYSLEPGEHSVNVAWREAGASSWLERSPEIVLDREAANVKVGITVPENRWLLWAGGPSWGPVVSLWQYVLVLFLVAGLLVRLAPTPLRYWDWLLLGAGMTQVPLASPVIVVVWILVLAYRARFDAKRWWSHNLFQLGLALLSLVAIGSLWAALQQGLLVQPDMQVVGGGSYGNWLHWYVDRVEGSLPRPWVFWLPLWSWRIVMLVWALWLASRLMKWIPWAWRQFGCEGLWRRREVTRTSETGD